jgi:hypothetical protein
MYGLYASARSADGVWCAWCVWSESVSLVCVDRECGQAVDQNPLRTRGRLVVNRIECLVWMSASRGMLR